MLDSTLAFAPQFPAPGLDPSTLAASEGISQLATSEWLGPMAPVALSPFFGLTALSGIATYGPDWLQQRSQLFSDTSLLNSPLLFWSMLVLTLVTSLPRFSKVSKPLALAAENLETYSAIIILVLVRIFSGAGGTDVEPQTAMVSAGLIGPTVDVLMSAVAALNVVVINGVKLFCEFAIWLIPFPTIDAIVEVANKSLCAGLMGLYCFSPTAATAVNLLVLTGCAMIFGWTYRRLRYYRQVIAGPLLAWLMPAWFAQRGNVFVGFCAQAQAGMPKFAPVHIRRLSATCYRVEGRWLWRKLNRELTTCVAETEPGLVATTLTLTSESGEKLAFLHRRWVSGDEAYVGEAAQTMPSV